MSQIFHDLMIEAVEKMGDLPILLSGGIDSATILFAAKELGWSPRCITFHLDNMSTDALTSISMAETLGCKIDLIKIPTTLDKVHEDVLQVIGMGTSRKVFVQCMHPFLYMVPHIKSLGWDKAYWGMCSGSLVGDSREAFFAHHRSNEEWNEYRATAAAKTELDPENVSEGWMNIQFEKYYGFEGISPYRHKPLYDNILSRTFEELHRPKNKILYVKAFQSFWDLNKKWYRPHDNLQINSGLRDLHEKLKFLPEYKHLNAKSVSKVYNYIYQNTKTHSLETFFT